MKKMRQNKDIRLSGTLADRWETIQRRFGYSTNIKLIDDLMYFFETNSVSPRDRFDNLFAMLNAKIDEFNKDNNRVITIVRNIEKVKLDPIIRSISTDMAEDLRIIKRKLLFSDEFKTPTENNNKIENKIQEKIKAELTEKHKNRINEHIKDYAELKKQFDVVTVEHARIIHKLTKLSKLYSVEKSTFSSKNKIVFEMTETEFVEIISLK
jgi:hypothetical protein